MRNIALFLALCATLLCASCAAEAGSSSTGGPNANSWQQPSADAGSSDSSWAQADASNQQQTEVATACVFAQVPTDKVWKCADCENKDAVYDTNFKVNTKKCTLDTGDWGVYKSSDLTSYSNLPPPVTLKLEASDGSNAKLCCVEAQ